MLGIVIGGNIQERVHGERRGVSPPWTFRRAGTFTRRAYATTLATHLIHASAIARTISTSTDA